MVIVTSVLIPGILDLPVLRSILNAISNQSHGVASKDLGGHVFVRT